MYKILKPLLFLLDPERAHACALAGLHYLPAFCFRATQEQPVHAMGLTFAHRIGLAAGFDKSGAHVNALAKLGFAFIEVGTVTPRPQLGQTKPRLFRLPQASALINRMGFNNPGVDAVVTHLSRSNFQGILGLNIGKSRDTSLDLAVEDYLYCLQKVYAHASYVAINISSPNTPELRQLQTSGYFSNLMQKMRAAQLRLTDKHGKYVPLLVKISPDEAEDTLQQMAEVMLKQGIDGIIATNTTCVRDAVSTMAHGRELGGLSGQPLLPRATRCLTILKEIVGDALTLVGVGGIDSLQSAQEKLVAGATLLQVYTGLIYRGPGLISELSRVQPRGINELP